MDEVKLEAFKESVAVTDFDFTYDVRHPKGIKEEFSSHSYDCLKVEGVKPEDTCTQRFDFQIKSEVPDTKVCILNIEDEIPIKTEPLDIEEIHIKTDQAETATDQTINLSTCEEQGIAEECVPEGGAVNCNKYSPNEVILDGSSLHLKTRTSGKSLKSKREEHLKILKSKYRRKDDLTNNHIKTHAGDKPYKCDVCDYRCTRKDDLTKHLRTHTGEKPFQCDVCNYKFTQKISLNEHLRTHTGEKPFECNVCGNRYARKDTLNNHIKTHTGDKPYKCNVCKYNFAKKSTLTEHLKTHTGEKPFKCDVCDHRCTRKADLAKHVRTHTGEKPFKCNLCNYRVTQQSSIKEHMKVHTGEKPLKCLACDYSCAWKSSLKVHMKRHIGEKST